MGRIKELIDSFINPVKDDKSFDKLAEASGVSKADTAELKDTMEGVKDFKFAGAEDENKGDRNKKVGRTEVGQQGPQTQPVQREAEPEPEAEPDKDLGTDR